MRSSLFPLDFVQKLADPIELLRRGPAGGERAHHEARGRSSESAVKEVTHDLLLRLLAGELRRLDVRPLAFVAASEPLLRHDLKELQNRGVAGRPPRVQGRLD